MAACVSSCGGGGTALGGSPGGGNPASLSIVVSPNPVSAFPNSSFTVTITAATNASVTPTVTLSSLPSGFTTTTTFPLSVPSSGASVTFQASSSVAAGNYMITFNGQAGAATAAANLTANVQTTAPAFFFETPLFSELAIAPGGSARAQFTTIVNGTASYQIQLSVSGLPAGVTASLSPQTITSGQSTTLTLTAGPSAPVSQNVFVRLLGTPSAPVPAASVGITVDVTPPPGTSPNSHTDYVSTDGTPYAAVYDRAHQLVFASNEAWNRVDVISSSSHAIVSRVQIPDPRGVDITQDNSTIWVATGSRQVFSINTATMAVSRYLLPQGPHDYWEGSQLIALSDGTIMLVLTPGTFSGISGMAIWDPSSNAISFPQPPVGIQSSGVYRSGDGKRVYFLDSSTAANAFFYDVQIRTFSKVSTAAIALSAAVNFDGSRVAICDDESGNTLIYDGSFNLIGSLPFCGFGGPPLFEGGAVFSPDNRFLYEEVLSGIPAIVKVDSNTLNIVTVAPAMPMIPVMTELDPPYLIPIPFAVDDSGQVLGVQDWGIAFDDSTFAQTYTASQPGTPTFLQHMDPYFGPLSGGTASGGFGNAFSITPDVWYGPNRGSGALSTSGTLTITSPPSSTPGPVNLKFLFPDGVEVFNPLFFSYGPFLENPIISGASPAGNVPGQIVGYGMPGDDRLTGTLKIGTSTATLIPPTNGALPFAGTPYPDKVLSYTVPAGSPGWADISLTTTDGTSTLPKSFFYAKSVTDFPSSDAFTAILYDGGRQRLYLSAGDHVDVFSLATNQFLTPLNPPARGATKLFAGLALTPDGSQLLVTDLLDGSLSVINPDNPVSAFVIPIAPLTTNGNPGCNVGPLYVASTFNNTALVLTGGLLSAGCGPSGAGFLANLTTHTASLGTGCTGEGAFVSSTKDGRKLVVSGSGFGGFCIYDVASNSSIATMPLQAIDAVISGDGQLGAASFVVFDSSADVIGRVGRPDVFYDSLGGSNSLQPELLRPQLNDSGSLYYMAFSNFIDIIDVRHSFLRMRFGLSETVTNTAAPIAIDPTGRFIFLLTNRGLTIVDLGQAPLSVGTLSSGSAMPGTQITVRGSGFDVSTKVTVGGEVGQVTLVDQNTLTLTIPTIAAGPAAIVLTKGDGTSYTALGLLTIQ
ncbi:MAG TPA: IPT/TIG domain-containing protein [Candidatus Acidoferrum sp.]